MLHSLTQRCYHHARFSGLLLIIIVVGDGGVDGADEALQDLHIHSAQQPILAHREGMAHQSAGGRSSAPPILSELILKLLGCRGKCLINRWLFSIRCLHQLTSGRNTQVVLQCGILGEGIQKLPGIPIVPHLYDSESDG